MYYPWLFHHILLRCACNLSIKPKTTISKIDKLKDYIRGINLDPEIILTREAQSMPGRTYVSQDERDSHTLGVLEADLQKHDHRGSRTVSRGFATRRWRARGDLNPGLAAPQACRSETDSPPYPD